MRWTSKPAADHMRRSAFGRFARGAFTLPVIGRRLLSIATLLEGGQLFSLTLRTVLRQRWGVTVGPYSYGSLLDPGMADSRLTIGAYVSIGPGVRRFGANHPVNSLLLNPFAYNPNLGLASPGEDVKREECVIHDEAWIGAGVILTPRCRRVGFGAVIGAGSVVTRDVPDFAVFAGNPARQIGQRLTESQRAQLLAVDLSSMTPTALLRWARQILDGRESPPPATE